jgi:ABC-type lipoprotein release transport system permease subunit
MFTLLVAALACFLPARGVGARPPATALQTE